MATDDDRSGRSGGPVFIERTIVFTDIEGSTERWETAPEAMRHLLRHHDELIATVVERHGGAVVQRTGDGAIALFEHTLAAVHSVLELQAELPSGPGSLGLDVDPLRVRVGVHRGVIEPRDGDYFGPPMHRAARVMAAGHGGQILLSGTAAERLLADASSGDQLATVDLVDRGVHRLKGFHEPERLTEIVMAGAIPDGRELRTENAVEGWLPHVELDTLVGRDDDVRTVADLLDPGGVVTLVGTGGVGKTRLALHVAHRVRAGYPDGVWFVDLAAVSDGAHVLTAVVDGLGLADESVTSPADLVRAALGGRRALVVLDNCEHVIHAVAACVRAVLPAGAEATLLCTSQRDLGVSGETVVPIRPLVVDDDDIASSPAGRLFLQRARLADPDFEPDEVSMNAVGEICRRLDGLPLALELAAARVRVMGVGDIADRLRTTFDLLRSRDGPERHRTLAATISWSVDLLEHDDRETLHDLSVFNGSFGHDAVTTITGRDEIDVIDTLDELVRRSLVVRVDSRFRMLVPLRLVSAETLERSGRSGSVRGRHATWAAGTVPRPLDDPDAAVVAARMDALIDAIDDLRAAHRWFLVNEPPAAARLALDLADLWITRGRCHEAISWLTDCDVAGVPPDLRVEALGWIAGFGWTVGRNEEGERMARRALDIAEANALPLPTFAATRLAVRLAFSNRTEEALRLALDVERELRRGNGDVSRLFGPLSVVVAVGGDVAHAVELADEAIAEARSVGAVRLLGAMTNRLLITPGADVVDELSARVSDLARTLGRTSAQAHAVQAMAHRHRHDGDVAAFLRGMADFCDLMVDDEPTAVVGSLQVVPEAAAATRPREAAVLLGAVEGLAEVHDHRGTDLERARRRRVTDRLIDALDEAEFERAVAEGRGMSLHEAVDLLRWLADPVAANEMAISL